MISKKALYVTGAAFLLGGFGVGVIAGCNTNGPTASPASSAAPGMLAAEDEGSLESAGARLWAQNCIRCHNMRTPAGLSDKQWQIAMHHMRVRAGLTAQEHESILRFLQAAN